MLKALLISACVAVSSAKASEQNLITYDGSVDTGSFQWRVVNDPVMGGVSTSNFSINAAEKYARFAGTVRDVPSLGVPGFCQPQTTDIFGDRWPDASGYITGGLEISYRSRIDYKGWKVSFAADTLNPQFDSYKASFDVIADNRWRKVYIPFSEFSKRWDPATGDPVIKCSDDITVCPTGANLAGIFQWQWWAEGAGGDFDIDLEYARAVIPPY